MTGIWGTSVANETTREADVIVAIGTGFGEADCSSWNPKFTFAIPPSRLVQIDSDPQEIGKIYPVEVGIVGDAKETLRELIQQVKADGRTVRAVPLPQSQRWRKERKSGGNSSLPARAIRPSRFTRQGLLFELSKVLTEDTIVVTDVGWNKNGAAQQLQSSKPGTFITSGGLATMGFGPAAAIGAKIGAPDRKVVCLVGDGGLLSVVGALTTAVELGVPVLWVLFNNFCFSTIRTVGMTYFKNSYGTEFTRPDGTPYNPDFPLLAKAFGIESALVEEPEKLGRSVEESLRC